MKLDFRQIRHWLSCHTSRRFSLLFTATMATAVFALATVLFTLCPAPTFAHALSYSIDPVTIDAQILPDGSLHVSEKRTFNFLGTSHGVYWKLPQGAYNGKNVTVEIEGCGVMAQGAQQAFASSITGAQHTYQLSNMGNYLQLKLYNNVDDASATYWVDYTIENLATAYADTAELYWKFVSDGWDVPSQNVTCTISLPVPQGQSVSPGQNVHAYGHGALDASLDFEGDAVIYHVPQVGTQDFAEARILFPVEWLSVAPSNQAHLETALSEEEAWAQEANKARSAARIKMIVATTLIAFFGILTIIWAVVAWHRYKRTHKPLFQDEYFRDAPTSDHPALLGALFHNNNVSAPELSATLMHLVDAGYITLDTTQDKHPTIALTNKSQADLDPLDTAFIQTFFGNIASLGASDAIEEDEAAQKTQDSIQGVGAPQSSAQSLAQTRLDLASLSHIAREHPQSYKDAIDGWKTKVQAAGMGRGFYLDTTSYGKGLAVWALIIASIVLVGGIATFAYLGFFFSPWWVLAIPLAGLVLSIIALAHMHARSKEAIEIDAQLHALQHWFKDFTKLDEAVPQDVVLWNKLLVLAVALGVSKEVLEQLKVAAPAIANDPAFAYWYPWYWSYRGIGGVYRDPFAASALGGYRASTAALASSHASSGSGAGGGFSGGGGGGFGGGGGGGAF